MATSFPPMSTVHDQRDQWRAALVLLGVLLIAVGCNTPQDAPKPLTNLRLPGVTPIPGITTLPGPAGIITAVSAYPPAIPAAPARVVIVRDGSLYDVGLDGSALRALPMPVPCGRTHPVGLAANPDGQRVVCDSRKGIALTSLVAQMPDGGRLVLANAPGQQLNEPTWSPDGQHLAVMDDLCTNTIDLFTMSADSDSLRLTAQLRLVAAGSTTTLPFCALFTLAWSPDGAWLALLRSGQNGSVAYAIPVATFLPQLPAFDATLITRTIELPTLIPLTPDGLFLIAPAWSRNAGTLALTFVTNDGQDIAQVALGSTKLRTLLHVPEGYVSALTWTPDGRHLVFAVSVTPCADCRQRFTPSHLYVYTPSP